LQVNPTVTANVLTDIDPVDQWCFILRCDIAEEK